MAVNDTNDVLSRARALLREGKTQEADDLITQHQAALSQAPGAPKPAAPAPQPLPEPSWFEYAQEAEQLLMELLAGINLIVAHLGSPPALGAIVEGLFQRRERLAAVRPGPDAPAPGR